MNLRKPEKMMQIYWSETELDLINQMVDRYATHDSVSFLRESILQKTRLGIEALQAYKKGDEVSQEIYEICKKQNETEALV